MSGAGTGPTDAEIEAWALRERRRREQWARGPTPEQSALWVLRERERRIIEHEALATPTHGAGVRWWPLERTLREVQLAGIGALRLVVNTSIGEAVEYLVQAGLDWEAEQVSRPARGPQPARRR